MKEEAWTGLHQLPMEKLREKYIKALRYLAWTSWRKWFICQEIEEEERFSHLFFGFDMPVGHPDRVIPWPLVRSKIWDRSLAVDRLERQQNITRGDYR